MYKRESSYNSEILLLGIYPRELKPYVHTHTHTHTHRYTNEIAALFIAQKWKQFKGPSNSKQINKM